MQNAAVKMTKEQYFEMCEMLGTQPKDIEIPVEYNDFPIEIQEAFSVYSVLQDIWDTFGGNYMGKNLSNIKDVFYILNVEKSNYVFMLELISFIDNIRVEELAKKKDTNIEKPAIT